MEFLNSSNVFMKARVASGETINSWTESQKCPHLKNEKQIVHPGEVNKIRECPLKSNILITHTDSPNLYVWDTEEHNALDEDQQDDELNTSKPQLLLVGHEKNAEYALSLSTSTPKVVSGGHDSKLLIWDLRNDECGLLSTKPLSPAPNSPSTPTLSYQTCLMGHEDNIEDVVFSPYSDHDLASVGDDYKLLFWDTRTHNFPVATVFEAHGRSDLHCVDWSKNGHLIATGSADGVLKVWDRRKLTSPDACAFSFSFHKKAIMRVEWDPFNEGIVASGGEDTVICVWDLYQRRVRSSEVQENKRARRSVPSELLFQHNGHHCVIVDFEWNPHDPWTMLSVSDDVSSGNGGGTLQMWRISDLIHRPEHEVLQELQQHAKWIVSGKGERVSDQVREEVDTPASVNIEVKNEEQSEAGNASNGVNKVIMEQWTVDQVDIVIPTIRDLDFLEDWREFLSPYDIIIVQDGDPKRHITVPEGFKYRIYTRDDIQRILGDKSWCISIRDSACRCFGWLISKKRYIYTLDDDCLIALDPNGLRTNPIETHLNNLTTPATPFYFNTLYDPFRSGSDFVRGYPFSLRTGVPTVVSHGLWLNIPDYDAPTQLVKPHERNRRFVDCTVTIPQGTLFSMCGMNLAFDRERIGAAMYFGLMGEGRPLSRYDDMWAGWCMKVISDHLQFGVKSGLPYIWHNKASDPMINLRKEYNGLFWQEELVKFFNGVKFPNEIRKVEDCMVYLAEEVKNRLVELDPYFRTLSDAMLTWIELWRSMN
eukprot:g5373.t1